MPRSKSKKPSVRLSVALDEGEYAELTRLGLRDLAEMVAGMSGCEIAYLPNPRNEKEENNLVVRNDSLRGFGWEPILLDQALMTEVIEITQNTSTGAIARRFRAPPIGHGSANGRRRSGLGLQTSPLYRRARHAG